MGKEFLLKLLVFGGLLLVAASCTNGFEGVFARTESGGVITYAIRTELVVLMFLVMAAMAMVAVQCRRRKESFWVALAALFVFFSLVLIPIIAFDRLRIAKNYFEDQYFYWWVPAVDRYEFANLAQLRIEYTTSTVKGIKVRSYRLQLTDHDGGVKEVKMGDSKARATLDVANAAREAGVLVNGLTIQLRRDAGETFPDQHGFGFDQDPGKVIEVWNRKQATLQRIEALQEEFGLSDEAFEQLLRVEWNERNPNRSSHPWQFRLGDAEPTLWRSLQEWDYEAVRARAEEANAEAQEAESQAAAPDKETDVVELSEE